MELNLVIGRSYVVSTATECTVTDALGRLLCTATAGQQHAFVASTAVVTVSDDAASVVAVIKGAPALGGGGGSSYTLTAEAVEAVIPITAKNNNVTLGEKTSANTNSVAVGYSAKAHSSGVAIGYGAKATTLYNCAVGSGSSATSNWSTATGYSTSAGLCGSVFGANSSATAYAVAVGWLVQTKKGSAVTIGSQFSETVDGESVTRTCTTEGTGSITIGAGANTLNTTASDGTVTESSNAVTIGCKASNSGADSVCVGAGAQVSAGGGIAIGAGAVCADVGAVVFASYSSDRSYKTQLYFAGAGTPLAVQYYNGEAMIGYIVTDSAGNTVACGTNKLSALFPDNSATQAAAIDENGEWVMPTLFEPNDVKVEPSAQAYTPLPVYPIVEPEIEELTEE